MHMGWIFLPKFEFTKEENEFEIKGPHLPETFLSMVVESRFCKGHNLRSGCRNHRNFMLLERYFDEEDVGIGLKGWKWSNFPQKLKYHSTLFLMGLHDNSTPWAHIWRSERWIWEKLYIWKYKTMNITYEVIYMVKNMIFTSKK